MDPFIGEVKLLPWSWAPKGWALCDGRLLPIGQNTALFSLLGVQFGGNGQQTFALPDLRGRTPEAYSLNLPMGTLTGTETVSLTPSSLPAHAHNLAATSAMGTTPSAASALIATDSSTTIDYLAVGPGTPFPLSPSSIGQTGNNVPHNNMQPYLVMNYCIALQGIYPSRN
ncbi:MAG: tail fiber protein [Sphingomonas sp.]|nr:tail fiber protein [Sphingomonas sp.]